MDSVIYPSVENAYQAAKTTGDRTVFCSCGPGEAKRLGRQLVIREDWDKIKIEVMRDLIRQKFKKDSLLGTRLLLTGDELLVEGNSWGDVFWGVCNGVGENNLGKILMEQRAAIKRNKNVI